MTTEVPNKYPRPWTVAIYMVADGPSGSRVLDEIAQRELIDILRAATANDPSNPANPFYVAIQMDLHDRDGILRIAVDKDATVTPVREDVSTNTNTLADFFTWVGKECPAERYVVIFWGHSSGPVGLFGDRASELKPLTRLTLPKLQRAIMQSDRALNPGEQGSDEPTIDIAVFKDCWMGTLEMAYELRGSARFMIASQGRVPQVGWPYREMFASLRRQPKDKDKEGGETKAVARRLLENLGAYYDLSRNRPGKDEVPFSLVDIDKADVIASRLNELAVELNAVRKKYQDTEVAAADADLATTGQLLKSVSASGSAAAVAEPATVISQIAQPATSSATRSSRKEIEKSRAALESASRSDPALVDLRAVYQRLKALSNGNGHNGDKRKQPNLLTIGAKLDEAVADAVTRARTQSAFGGLSVFYYPRSPEAIAPPEMGGSLISPSVARDLTAYRELALSKKTHWDWIALERWQGIDFGRNGRRGIVRLDLSFLVQAQSDLFTAGDLSKGGDFFKGGDFVKGGDFDDKGGDFSKGGDFGSKGGDFGSKGGDFATDPRDFPTT